jgi:hypothetical protein
VKISALVPLLLLSIGSFNTAHASLIRYQAVMSVDPDAVDPALYAALDDLERSFAFAVDSAILQSDGDNIPAMPQHLRAVIGTTVWDQDQPSDLSGLRGPCYGPNPGGCDFTLYGLGSDYWGFQVSGGELTGLWGGIFGAADFPYIDFLGDGYSAFFRPVALGDDGAVIDRLRGSWSFSRQYAVNAPGTVLLLGIGLLMLPLSGQPQRSMGRAKSALPRP